MEKCIDPISVERQLGRVCRKLNVEEVNIGLFRRMIRTGVATNDVRSFTEKQQKLKSSKVKSNGVLLKTAMRLKLNDACSTADKLRREKKRLRESLQKEVGYSRSKAKRTVRKIMNRANNCRYQQKLKTRKKYEVCKSRCVTSREEEENSLLPDDVWEYVKDIDVFKKDVKPEKPADPMVCSQQIKLSRCERAFLMKGPKFMVRDELDTNEFLVDLQKMIIKEKYDKAGKEDDEENEEGNHQKSRLEEKEDLTTRIVEAKACLVYDKEDFSLDLGRMRATDYKYNKLIHLPKPENVKREAQHEMRKEQMLRVFKSVKDSSKNKKKGVNDQFAPGADRRIMKKTNKHNKPVGHGPRSKLTSSTNNTIWNERKSNQRPCYTEQVHSTRACPAKYNTQAEREPIQRACPAKYNIQAVSEHAPRACPAKYTDGVEQGESESKSRACPAKYTGVVEQSESELKSESRACPAKYSEKKQSNSKLRACPTKFESNLTDMEMAGLESLQRRVAAGELVITETDKSKRFCILTTEQYFEAGRKHVENDLKVGVEEVCVLQKLVNDHCHWLSKIFNVGANWEHSERISQSMCDRGEVVAPLYLLIKDHKGWKEEDGTPPPSRPVCSGNRGYNRHLSELLSLVLEPVSHALQGYDIDSTGELLMKIESLNEQLQSKYDTSGVRIKREEKSSQSNNVSEEGGEDEIANDKRKNKSKPESVRFGINMKEKRVEGLRKMKIRGSKIPSVKSKLWASRIQDELSEGEVIRTSNKHGGKSILAQENAPYPPIQSDKREEYSIIGTDVESLFPSLKDIESARIAREAVLLSRAEYCNVDYETALRYLIVTGGTSHMREIGLNRVSPRWIGSRPDLLTVGGTSIGENDKWTKMTRNPTEEEKRIIVSRVVETAILVCMNTHIYQFGEDLYLQQSGGPIGMRFTAALASVVMKMWDLAWLAIMKRENIVWDLYLRYVDDCRLFFPTFNKGWYWNGNKFVFSREREAIDMKSEETDEHRTAMIISEAMSSLVPFLKFTGEEKSMFPDQSLPTLDTTLWMSDGEVRFKFYEKPTVGNQVVHKQTALPKVSIEATLIQETVRRLKNSSRDIDPAERSKLLSKLSNKIVNSGHSIEEAKRLIVKGVAKYLYLRECSDKPKCDPNFRPLYLWKEFKESERQVTKYMAKMGWYRRDDECFKPEVGDEDGLPEKQKRACPAKLPQNQCSKSKRIQVEELVNHELETRACPAKLPQSEERDKDGLLEKRACPAKLPQNQGSKSRGVQVEELVNLDLETRACPAKLPQLDVFNDTTSKATLCNSTIQKPRACPAKLPPKYEPNVGSIRIKLNNNILQDPRAYPDELHSMSGPETASMGTLLSNSTQQERQAYPTGSAGNGKNEPEPFRSINRRPGHSVEGWKKRLVGVWRKGSMTQRRASGMQFSTMLQVASSKGGRLLKKLIDVEDKLAELTGYNVKLVEKSGTQLSRLFRRVYTPKTCHWNECPTCMYSDERKPSKCRSTNIVYEAVCVECEEEIKKGCRSAREQGRYIGESSRTLCERSKEHVDGAQNLDSDNFIVKHWVSCHSNLTNSPRMRFKVLKSFQDVLSRLATEAVFIEKMATMNSKSEFRCNKLSRIVILDPRKKREEVDPCSKEEAVIQEKIRILKEGREVDLARKRRSKIDSDMLEKKKKTLPKPVKIGVEKRKKLHPPTDEASVDRNKKRRVGIEQYLCKSKEVRKSQNDSKERDEDKTLDPDKDCSLEVSYSPIKLLFSEDTVGLDSQFGVQQKEENTLTTAGRPVIEERRKSQISAQRKITTKSGRISTDRRGRKSKLGQKEKSGLRQSNIKLCLLNVLRMKIWIRLTCLFVTDQNL